MLNIDACISQYICDSFFFLQVRGPIPIQLGTDVLPSIKTIDKNTLKIFRNILIPINFHKFFGDILTKTSFCFTDDSMSSWGSGSSVLDLIFPQPETISEIRFRNWYTARLSILVRFDDSVQAPPKSSSLNWAAAAVSTNIVLMKIIYLYLLHM